jgi:hypothetical protein
MKEKRNACRSYGGETRRLDLLDLITSWKIILILILNEWD